MRLGLCLFLLAIPPSASAQELDPNRCLSPPYTQTPHTAQQELAALVTRLRPALDPFPSLAEALETGVGRLCLTSTQSGASGYFAPGQKTIVLHDSLDADMRAVVLIHELRHLDQTRHGVCPGQTLSRAAYARAVMAMEADASAVTALVTWSWAEQGNAGPWNALAGWSSQADIAERFAQEMSQSGKPDTAVSAAFDQWYASADRYQSYWYSACSAYLDREDASHSLPGYGALDPAFWTQLCVLPNGKAYACRR
jgi:hypothetical protein